jgi:diadenosine tetraphosphate (Ap4A) HIT family hydrolase
MTFVLDPQLAQDTVPVIDLGLSTVLLMNDSRFPWLILVPRRPALSELIDLDEASYALQMAEVRAVSEALRDLVAPHKLNVAALGNSVRQLHIHVIARFREDVAWPRPVWGVGTATPYDPEVRDALRRDLVDALEPFSVSPQR